jgi:hypothetical protein
MPARLSAAHNLAGWQALTNQHPIKEGRSRMPLLRYFGVAGPALLMLLLGVNWILPESVPEPAYASIERPGIRISSIEKLPERVVFDTSLPPIALPPKAVPIAIPPPQSAFAFVQITPGPLPAFSKLAEVAPKQPIAVKRDPARKVAARRAPPPAPGPAAKNYNLREVQANAKPPIRTTFLDDIAGRFGQIFKVN